MPADLVLVVLAGAAAGGGAALLLVALRGRPPRPPRPTSTDGGLLRRLGRRTMVSAAVAVVVLVATGWPVAALGAAGLVVAWPSLFGGAKAERQAIARVEGLASWTESLRDTIAGAVGLEQAIPATVYAASPAIQPQLRLLVDRLRVRVPLPVALQRLADDLDDPSADLVVAALILNAKLRGPGLRQVLGSLSAAARAELDMRQRVAAGRSSTRRSSQIVIVFSLAVISVLSLANREYVAPYGTPTGQLVLVVVVGCFAGGFWWMKRLSGVEGAGRFLVATPERQAPADRTGPSATVTPAGRLLRDGAEVAR